MIESLADQHDICARLHKFLDFLNPFLFQVRLQLILKELLPQQVETVTGHAPEHVMHYACCKFAVGSVKKRPQNRHQEDQAAAAKPFGKGLRIPGKECHRPDDGQV